VYGPETAQSTLNLVRQALEEGSDEQS